MVRISQVLQPSDIKGTVQYSLESQTLLFYKTPVYTPASKWNDMMFILAISLSPNLSPPVSAT